MVFFKVIHIIVREVRLPDTRTNNRAGGAEVLVIRKVLGLVLPSHLRHDQEGEEKKGRTGRCRFGFGMAREACHDPLPDVVAVRFCIIFA